MATYKTGKPATGRGAQPAGQARTAQTHTPSGPTLADSSPATLAQHRLQRLADSSPRAVQLKQQAGALAASPASAAMERLQQMANASPRTLQFERPAAPVAADGSSTHAVHPSATTAAGPAPVQRMADQAATQGNFGTPSPAGVSPNAPSQLERKPNRTGLPDRLKAGIESLSGMNMDHVRVYYNSAKPAQLQAHAYAQGSEIHVATGQERHLPHEAWHVVQQAQGRVRPTLRTLDGLAINNERGLEADADRRGEQASRRGDTRGVIQPQIIQPEMIVPASNIISSTQKKSALQLATKITHTAGTAEYGDTTGTVGVKMKAILDPKKPLKGSEVVDDKLANISFYEKIAELNSGKFARGHLLNHDLGGFGVSKNLFPISGRANSLHAQHVEQHVKGLLQTADTDDFYVWYSVDVIGNPEHSFFVCNYGKLAKDKPETKDNVIDLETRVIESRLHSFDNKHEADGGGGAGAHGYRWLQVWRHPFETRNFSKNRWDKAKKNQFIVTTRETDDEKKARLIAKSPVPAYIPTQEELENFRRHSREALEEAKENDLKQFAYSILDTLDQTVSTDSGSAGTSLGGTSTTRRGMRQAQYKRVKEFLRTLQRDSREATLIGALRNLKKSASDLNSNVEESDKRILEALAPPASKSKRTDTPRNSIKTGIVAAEKRDKRSKLVKDRQTLNRGENFTRMRNKFSKTTEE